jgi:hypothetical protein
MIEESPHLIPCAISVFNMRKKHERAFISRMLGILTLKQALINGYGGGH